MKDLHNLILQSEDWLIDRVLAYAVKANYVKYTSTLKEAWRKSIAGLSIALTQELQKNKQIPEQGPDGNFKEDAIASFGMLQARNHRARGITLVMYLGLFKYYRQSYLDLIENKFKSPKNENYRLFIERFFDRVELGVIGDWTGLETDSALNELKAANRMLTNEKNKYLTICESIPSPVVLVDEENRISFMNHAAMQLFSNSATPGENYYSGVIFENFLNLIEKELKIFGNDSNNFQEFEKNLVISGKELWFSVNFKKMLDISGKFSGTVIILNDVTELKQAEAELKKQYDFSAAAEQELQQSNIKLNQVNEELVATNEELIAVEEELRHQVLELEINRNELREVNRQLQDIIEFLPDATFVVDRNRNVIAWNHAIEKFTGVSKHDVIGKGSYAYAVPLYGRLRPALIDLVLGDKLLEPSYLSINKKGNVMFAEIFSPIMYRGKGGYLWITASPLYDSRGNLAGAIESIRDITKIKRTEEELYREKERLRVTLSSIGDGVIAVDTEGKVTLVNAVAEQLTGYNQLEAVGKPISETFKIINEQTRKAAENPIGKVLSNGIIIGLANHTALIAKDRTERSIADSAAPIKDLAGNTLGAVLVFRDVTEERKILEALEKSEQRFRLLAENAWDIIYRVSFLPEVRFEYISPAVTGISGYTPQQHYHEPQIITKLIYPPDKELLLNLASGNADYSKPVALRWIGKEGGIFWMELRNVPVYDIDGKLIALEGIARDITERKQAEEILKRYQLLSEHAREIILFVREDGNIIEANAAAVKAYGYTREELLQLNLFRDIRHKSHDQLIKKQLKQAKTKGVLFETMHVQKDGQAFPVEVSSRGAVMGEEKVLLSIIRDITERKQAEEELYDAHQRLVDTIEFLPDATFVIDKKGYVIAWNNAMEEMTGILKQEIIGEGNYSYSVPFYGEPRPALIDSILDLKNKNLYPKAITKGRKMFAETFAPSIYNGKGAFLWVTASPLYDREGSLVGAIESIRDITERKQMEEQLSYLSKHDNLTGLYNRSHFEYMMHHCQDSCKNLIGIIVCDLDGLKLVNDTMGHSAGDRLLVAAAEVIKNSFRKRDFVARVGGDEFAIILKDSNKDFAEEASRRIQEKIILYNEKNSELPLSISIGFAFTENPDTKLIDVYKEADNNMYRRKLHRKQSARSSIVKTLMKALEARDFITEGHGDRLQYLVANLARRLNLPEQKINDLRLLAQFHDIGKVGIPDRILFKPGPLTKDEAREMQRHCEIGNRIALSSIDLIPIADWILKHHEWWNGSGYPLGIKGAEIPLECRIIAIADAYDAMTSDRPYRKALSHEQALKEIYKCSGSQFDPQLVEIFIENFDSKKLN